MTAATASRIKAYLSSTITQHIESSNLDNICKLGPNLPFSSPLGKKGEEEKEKSEEGTFAKPDYV